MKHLYARFQWIALYSRRGPAWMLQHRVAVAISMAEGFVSVTKIIKMPRRMRTTAERKTDFLVSRLLLFSNDTLWRS